MSRFIEIKCSPYCPALLSLPLSTAEQRIRISASERQREYNEEQTNEYENYVEEFRDGKTCKKGPKQQVFSIYSVKN